MESISKATAQAFAQALIDNHGNATAAARSLKYDNAKDYGHRYRRHPLVLKALAPMAQAQLQSLTPQAIQTLGHLLNNGSPYVRLEAAKDVLDRNGVGTSREPPRSAQLVVNINLSPQIAGDTSPPLVLEHAALPQPVSEEGDLENSDPLLSSTSSAHDFSPEASHEDFSLEVLDSRISKPVERSKEDFSLQEQGSGAFGESSALDFEEFELE
jgi:hypothetical protein